MEQDRRTTMENVLGEEWVNVSQGRRSRTPFVVAACALVLTGIVSFFSIGGDGQTSVAQVQAQDAPILTIEAPETAEANEAFTITVSAKAGGAVKTDYLGTVVFTSDDPNAVLPGIDGEYTFTSEDAGVHEFPAAVKFTEAGQKSIQATDKADSTVSGEVTIDVTGAGTDATGGAPAITEPTDGQMVSTPSVTIRGTAPASVEVQLTDNGLPLSTLTSDATGSFSYTASNLTSGSHAFAAAANGVASIPVTVTVKTTAAFQQPDLILSPNPTPVNGSVTAQALADKNLRVLQILLDQRTIDLREEPIGSGSYTATFVAPQTAGAFPVVVHVEDDLGNSEDYGDLRVLTVTAGAVTPTVIPADNQPPTVSFTFAPVDGKAPFAVRFSSDARDPDGTIVSYAWEFGDGASSSEPNPTHTYTNAGKFFPKLTVTDNGGKSAAAVAARPVDSGPLGTILLLGASAALVFGFRRLKPARA